MKKLFPLLFFCFLFYFNVYSQITLTHNVGDVLVKTDMYTCYQTEWWARSFTLSEFGLTTNEELIISSGTYGITTSYGGATAQFNVYEIDSNFPNSFNSNNLIGSSQVEVIPYAWSYGDPVKVEITFDNPITVPANVEMILVEIKKAINQNSIAVPTAIIVGTEINNAPSWYKGCVSNFSYNTTANMNVSRPNANFYLTVNGEAKTIFPFEITNDNSCINFQMILV